MAGSLQTAPHLRIDPSLLEGDLISADHPLFGIVWINPGRVSGAPCFFGTRVPVKVLFDCLRAGQTLEEFLDDFEGIGREQALQVLSLSEAALLAGLPRQ